MAPPTSETPSDEVEHRAVVLVLRSHPEWTLDRVLRQVERGPSSAALRKLTIGDLLEQPRLGRAERARGAGFNRYVHELIEEELAAREAKLLMLVTNVVRMLLEGIDTLAAGDE